MAERLIWLNDFGGLIAQLVERFICNEEVRSSNLLESTKVISQTKRRSAVRLRQGTIF